MIPSVISDGLIEAASRLTLGMQTMTLIWIPSVISDGLIEAWYSSSATSVDSLRFRR